MLTKEKYDLLLLWSNGAGDVLENGKACFASGIVGIVLNDLPENHVLFSMDPCISMLVLGKLMEEYCEQLKDQILEDL